ncbi:uncharacterized protein METZ01_LOCUS46325 [marine metagenome]|uniref:Uncharacterized protein n=1 Tax=marine metagenome TaxID=408172 RepID=A0A381RQR0_9ZZZZ
MAMQNEIFSSVLMTLFDCKDIGNRLNHTQSSWISLFIAANNTNLLFRKYSALMALANIT